MGELQRAVHVVIVRGRPSFIIGGTLLLASLACAAEGPVVLGEKNDPPAIVTTAVSDGVASLAVERLASYLEVLTGARPALTREVGEAKRAIVCGDASIAAAWGVPAPDASSDESFSVRPVERDGRTCVVVCGRGETGIKQGVYYVLRNLIARDGKVLLNQPSVNTSPWITRRVSHIGGYTRQAFDRETGKRLPKPAAADPQQFAWNYITTWEPQRIGDYVDLLDFFGYNGIEEPPMLYAPTEKDDGFALERRKTIRDHVQRNGMLAVAKIDGTVFRDGALPYGADTKEQYDAYYRQMAEAAAPYNDFVLTHWVDAGGWKGDGEHPCTIELLQDLHMQVHREFRRVNPKIQSFLSLWYLDHPNYQRWLGYRGVETILKSGKIPGDIGLAMSRRYRPDEATKILAAGNKLAVWGWYTADHELLYTMHVHTNSMAEYFRQMPPDAGRSLFLHVLDNCQRETNLYTVYVGARMMWDPAVDPEVYLREVSRLVYGPKLEEPVFRALKAIADVRCGKKCAGCWSPESNGVVTFEQGLAQASEAYVGLKDIEVDRDYIPPVRFHRPAETLLAELKAHSRVVAVYMQFLADRRAGNSPPTEVPRAEGPFEFYERLRYLQNR